MSTEKSESLGEDREKSTASSQSTATSDAGEAIALIGFLLAAFGFLGLTGWVLRDVM